MVRLGKRKFGCEVYKWFSDRDVAVRWTRQQHRVVEAIGRRTKLFEQQEMLDFDEAHRLRLAAIEEGLEVPSVADMIRTSLECIRAETARKKVSYRQVREEWLDSLEGLSREYTNKARQVTGWFGEFYGWDRPANDVSDDDVPKWLKSRNVLNRTRIAYAETMATMWGWCAERRRRYVAENPWKDTEFRAEVPDEIDFLDLVEIATLLRLAAAEPGQPLLPFLVITVWAGPRVAEAGRLLWRNVVLDEEEPGVRLPRRITKTKRSRFVRLPAVAVAWLKEYTGPRTGSIAPPALKHRRALLHARAGFDLQVRVDRRVPDVFVQPVDGVVRRPWPRNGLRHTYCTYSLAALRNPEEVALCAGHSVRVLESEYAGLATPRQGRAYLELTPDKVLRGGEPGAKAA